MCDEHTEEDNKAYFSKLGVTDLSRRAFAVASAAAIAAVATPAADALTVAEQDVVIKTPDGECDAHVVAPSSGKHPAVLVWPDIMGLRPAFKAMGKRLSESGYAVLTINPFYRKQKGLVFDAATEKFSDAPVRARLMPLMQSLTADTNKVDAIAFTQWLDKQKQVDTKKKIGTTGYCMGGPLVFRSAAYVPNRIGAAATFHGGGIATDKPNSPHLLIPQMKASFLCCIADNDDKNDPESKNRLRAAFDAAKLPAEIEVYTGDQHGWCPPDSQVYDKVGAEKAWGRQLALFQKALA
jgi:carboxymethylenebutenolidase